MLRADVDPFVLGGISSRAGDWIVSYTTLLCSGYNRDPERLGLRFHLTDDGGATVEGRCPSDNDAGCSFLKNYTEVFSLARGGAIKPHI